MEIHCDRASAVPGCTDLYAAQAPSLEPRPRGQIRPDEIAPPEEFGCRASDRDRGWRMEAAPRGRCSI
eukprot:7944118-Alexandrium_andersonii.AAC.1